MSDGYDPKSFGFEVLALPPEHCLPPQQFDPSVRRTEHAVCTGLVPPMKFTVIEYLKETK